MGVNNAKVQSIIETSFSSALKTLIANETGFLTNDLYVQIDSESGELQIYDEDENLLKKNVVFDWVNSQEEAFDEKAIIALKSVFTLLTAKGMFNHSCFLRPFSVSLVDEDFNVIEELLFIDDESLRIDDSLLKDLDSELDSFLRDIMSDMPK